MRFLVIILLAFVSGIVYAQDKAEGELRRSVYFGGGSYYIDDQQGTGLTEWLDSIPQLLEKYTIQLISHTDPIGGKAYNEWLSEMRSDAVFNILINHEIPDTKITIKNWGLENPVYSNDNFQGMQMNRRVDVVVHPIVF